MTARLKHAMKDQRQGEGECGQSFDTGLGGLFQTSLEGRVLSANPAMARILGYESPEELTSSITGIGKQAYVHPEDRESLVSALTRERAVVGFECEVSRKDRRRIWVSISARLACSDAGEPLFVEGFLMDITERKLAQDEVRQLNVVLERRVEERTRQLEAVNKELEAFSHSVSHDLRAPLRGIDGFSQALLRHYWDRLDEQGRHYLERVRNASQRMERLIDDLLQLSRLTRIEMRRSLVDLSAMAQEIASALQASGPERRVTFVIAPGLTANADGKLMRAVLENLLGNAWKFTSKHPTARIELGSRAAHDERIYFVRDDGAGFDMAFAGKIFGAFQRMHSSAEFEGTGIGLATVHRAIHRHGGRLWAEAAPGKGATFYFALPA